MVVRLPARFRAWKASGTQPGSWVEVEPVRAQNAQEARAIVGLRECSCPSHIRVIKCNRNPVVTILQAYRRGVL